MKWENWEEWIEYMPAIIAFIGIVIYESNSIFVGTSRPLNTKVITEMSAKCDSNGGVESITHGYDVKCKNGAEFQYK